MARSAPDHPIAASAQQKPGRGGPLGDRPDSAFGTEVTRHSVIRFDSHAPNFLPWVSGGSDDPNWLHVDGLSWPPPAALTEGQDVAALALRARPLPGGRLMIYWHAEKNSVCI